MGQFLLLVVVALTVGAVVFGVTVLLTGGDGGLSPAEPDGRAVPLPGTRPLTESDIAQVRFDVATRGYRMAQVDQAMRRAAYDIGYKDELINVLEAEVDALRAGRFSDAEVLRRAREAAQSASPVAAAPEGTAPGDAPASARAEGDHETAAIDAGKAAKEPEPAWAERPSPAAGAERPSPVATAEEPSAAIEEPGAATEQPAAVAAEQPAAGGAAEPQERAEPPEPAAAKADETATPADAGAGNAPDTGGAGIDLGAGTEPGTAAAETDPGTATDEPESDSILPSRR